LASTGAPVGSFNVHAYPKDVFLDPSGNAFVTYDFYGYAEKYVPNGGGYTLSASMGGSLYNAMGIVVDAIGNVFVADTGNNQIVRFSGPTYGTGVKVADTASSLSTPYFLSLDPAGNLWVANNNSGYEVFSGTAVASAGSWVPPLYICSGSQLGSGLGPFGIDFPFRVIVSPNREISILRSPGDIDAHGNLDAHQHPHDDSNARDYQYPDRHQHADLDPDSIAYGNAYIHCHSRQRRRQHFASLSQSGKGRGTGFN
jgi:hypothetical protein